jgi:protein-disulfide isomerase
MSVPTSRALAGLVFAGATGLLLGAAAMRGWQARPATDAAAVRAALLEHPEIIPEAMARLQAREASARLTPLREEVARPFAGAWAGDPQGDVTLVMFTDYSCGFCRKSLPDIERLLAEDKRLKIVWREIPILGPPSEVAARAALAAAKQGRFPAFHHALFSGPRVDAARVAAAARETGLDPARLAADANGPEVAREIAHNLELAARLGVDGTPAFVIGDQLLAGAVGYDALAKAVRDARAKAG